MRAETPKILAFGDTDTGEFRALNEDSFLIDDTARLYLVADGMGGYEAGEKASRMAVDSVRQDLKPLLKGLHSSKDVSPVPDAVSRAWNRASRDIHAFGEANGYQGMGTTLTGVAFIDGHAVVGHVGDSRVYLLRAGTIRQLSKDHSMVAELVASGTMTEDQAKKSPWRNVITRAVGHTVDVTVDTEVISVCERDIYLLCSDGLVGVVKEDEMRDIVYSSMLSEVPKRLIDLANARGGPDNITALVLYVSSVQ
jgi:serine/threonine protein phosphatase PrpC